MQSDASDNGGDDDGGDGGGDDDDVGDGDDGDGDVDEYAIWWISSTLLCNQISLFIRFWLHLRLLSFSFFTLLCSFLHIEFSSNWSFSHIQADMTEGMIDILCGIHS